MTYRLEINALGDREIVMTRAFDAPRNLVFDAWTKPEILQRWLGARSGWTMAICEVDLRVGGAYRFVWRNDDAGAEMTLGGVYREIVSPARIVCTEKFEEAWYPGEGLITHELTEAGGVTTSRITMRYDSIEARDIVLASPMETGVAEGYDRLDGLLAALETAGANGSS